MKTDSGYRDQQVRVTVCVRGPSRSGKTAVCERVIAHFGAVGDRVAYIKRSHHLLDLPDKASGRIWARQPAAMMILASDRLQVTLPPTDRSAQSLLSMLPANTDIALLESHSVEAYPTVLACDVEPSPGEMVIARWSLAGLDRSMDGVLTAIADLFAPGAVRAGRSADLGATHINRGGLQWP